jgi:4-alpha-glucanotransferase
MTDAWSITDGYWDESGTWHVTTPEVRAALAAAMGAGDRKAPPPPPLTWFVTAGSTPALHNPADVTLEDGTVLRGVGELPWDLPLGYHSLQPLDGGPATRLVVTPHRCPEALRAWGWATQLYAMRSRQSWGMGDHADLARLARRTLSLIHL